MPIAGQILLLVITFTFTAGGFAAWGMSQASPSTAERLVWWAVVGLSTVFAAGCFLLLMSSETAEKE
ncbi:MAG: hypothetical protein C0467_31455 [Planctomycetaceae bacterium]|nr:hypothetical protein [Planctomycetaceae bacterium]